MFKDTSLVFILALTDLLQVGRLIPEQEPEFFGRQLEALLVVAFLFWVVSIWFIFEQVIYKLSETHIFNFS